MDCVVLGEVERSWCVRAGVGRAALVLRPTPPSAPPPGGKEVAMRFVRIPVLVLALCATWTAAAEEARPAVRESFERKYSLLRRPIDKLLAEPHLLSG